LFLLVALVVSACGAGGSGTPTPGTNANAGTTGLEVGQLAPSFSTQIVGSQQTTTLESLRGKIVLLNFWATWCGPCREEMPFFQKLTERYDAKDLHVLAINFREKEDTINKFTTEHGVKFPIGLDLKGEINRLYGVAQYPVTYMIGRDGKILARQYGPFIPPESLETLLKKWIAGQ
jgi:thiol-disulfide isomerase/thioredoxin